ncbi:putative 2-acylglycerol O-acyltransferase [Helianthus annuus]|uniref:2-acylglycerol O-acyltransferase n=2 Tax=Helianthus annuus TaxID=4232 RepID=A0A9K3NFV5_HELAN|nr:putative 2-acylglycerol O-acyltransferase [Helianthus annuus]KAJ0556945.1 putative 2-acylglycerol O-acyltransferase [Helianthus annuus]KAJ0563221.1 putative 2-acylglycerol O-acyltransferase [Helianthus annuus]KAJ0731331.1 putative 2-acylglycerol O-acyltransferase [Helianthus annuus]KAJ0904805.1 putative 2-acylglycerol O-acyltransferase [Helianthus annuus]
MALNIANVTTKFHDSRTPSTNNNNKGRRRRFAAVKMLKVEELTGELQEILNANMDDVKQRRRAREAFKDIQLTVDHVLFKTKYDGLKTKESYEVNSKGVEIFSKSWLPETGSPKAVICFCHGYGDTCTYFFEGIARKFASSGYGVLAMDFPGFGLSEGLHGYIPSFDGLVDDVIEHYSKIKENPELRDLPRFLLGESMGGAVAIKMHLKQPEFWNGAVLVAPMCKIADDVVPPWAVKTFLIGVAKVLPKYKLVPQKDLGDMAFRDPKKKPLTSYNVIAYKDRPRLGTAMELLNTTQDIENQLEKISLPLLILHGKADIVTDPSVSKTLYEKAKSSDKKLNLYDGCCHALLEGETDDIILSVFNDIISWLDKHSAAK